MNFGRNQNGYLHRTWYRTDATVEEPEYLGAFSETIPGTALEDREIVHVDWSLRGWVEVTFLVRGEHPNVGNVPWPEASDA